MNKTTTIKIDTAKTNAAVSTGYNIVKACARLLKQVKKWIKSENDFIIIQFSNEKYKGKIQMLKRETWKKVILKELKQSIKEYENAKENAQDEYTKIFATEAIKNIKNCNIEEVIKTRTSYINKSIINVKKLEEIGEKNGL